MRNIGEPPSCEKVDIRFRNDQIVRGVEPRKYRWTLDDRKFGEGYDFDIVDWQAAK